MSYQTQLCNQRTAFPNRITDNFKVLLAIAFIFIASFSRATTWTTSTAGAINTLTNWTNGTASPTSFATPGDTWVIMHNMTLATFGSWVVGTPASALSLVTLSSGGIAAAGDNTVTVYGNLNLAGGNFSEYSSTQNINIHGNFSLNGGTFSQSGTGNTRNIIINGDFVMNSGIISQTGTSTEMNMEILGNALISGDTLKATGTGVNTTINVHGDYTMTGGALAISGTLAIINLNVQGNFGMSGGAFRGVTGNTAEVIARIGGNCNISGTAMTTNGSAFGKHEFRLRMPGSVGTALVENTSSGVWEQANVIIDTGCIALLHNNLRTGTTPTGVVTVYGMLTCPSTYVINGSGSFTLSNIGNLLVAHPGGINGNISATGIITLSSYAKYVFNGTSPQVMGSLMPAPVSFGTSTGIVTIDNSAGVTLSGDMLINGVVSFVNGILHTGAYALTMTGTTGVILGAGPGKFVEGTLKKAVSGLSSVFYEVGGTHYAPVALAFSAPATGGNIGVKCTSGLHPSLGTSGVIASNVVNNFWTITTVGTIGPGTVSLTAQYDAADIIGGSNTGFITQKYTATSWLGTALATTNTSSPFTSAPSAIVPSALAGAYVFGSTCGTPITGATFICAPGGSSALSTTTPGGTWSSSNPAVAAISATGSVSATAAGTAIIYYITPSCSVSTVVSVGVTPTTGPSIVCPSSTISLANATSGGTWSSSAPSIASVSSSGSVSGISAGTAAISYTVGSCAPVVKFVTVSAIAPITGPSFVYAGGTTTLGCSTSGGFWTSSNPLLATISTTGVVSGLTAGTVTISYAVGSCISTKPLTVSYTYLIMADTICNPTDTTCNTPKFFVKVNGASTLLRLKTIYGDGYRDSIAFINMGSVAYANAAHAYAAAGCYTVKQVVYNNNIPMDSVTFPYHHSGCNNLSFKLYFDANGNCIKEFTEPLNVSPMLVKIDSAGIPIDTISVLSGFNYKVYGSAGTTYGFSVLTAANLYASCPFGGTWYETISGSTGSYPVKYFALSCTSSGVFDHSVFTAIPVTAANRLHGAIYVRNNYCTPVDATVTLKYSPLYTTIVYTSPAMSSSAPGEITWNISSLSLVSGVQTRAFEMKAATGAYLAVGSTVTEKTTISPIITDADTCNNRVIDNDTVTGPYDPNMIDIQPGSCFTDADTALQYTIHFENTGNDTAHNVHVLDTLSGLLEPRTLRAVIASHEMDICVYKDGPYSIAKFDFANIKLLDTSHHGLCDGAVIFTIKPKPGLPSGTIIANRAGIYFDYADVVMTNTIQTQKDCPTPSATPSLADMEGAKMYPNPAQNILTVSSVSDIHYLSITNLLGQEVYAKSHNTKSAQIDVSGLKAGMYLVRINNSDVLKFVKQ